MKLRIALSVAALAVVVLAVSLIYMAATPGYAQASATSDHGTCVHMWIEQEAGTYNHIVYRGFEDGHVEVIKIVTTSIKPNWMKVGK